MSFHSLCEALGSFRALSLFFKSSFPSIVDKEALILFFAAIMLACVEASFPMVHAWSIVTSNILRNNLMGVNSLSMDRSVDLSIFFGKRVLVTENDPCPSVVNQSRRRYHCTAYKLRAYRRENEQKQPCVHVPRVFGPIA